MARCLNILLAEDDPNDAVLVELALQKILPGVSLNVVPDGIQAIEYLKGGGLYSDRAAHPFPDVLLLDLKLPLMDGFEVLRWIRQQPEFKLLPVIGLTGSLRTEDSQLASASGANACVLKSQGFRRLAEAVMQVGGIATENNGHSETIENSSVKKIAPENQTHHPASFDSPETILITYAGGPKELGADVGRQAQAKRIPFRR